MEIQIKTELDRIINSDGFVKSKKKKELLKYLVNHKLNSPLDDLKELTIALDLYDKKTDFDPAKSSLIRSEVYRLRKLLNDFYDKGKLDSEIQIRIPKGKLLPELIVSSKKGSFKYLQRNDSIINNLPTIIIAPLYKNKSFFNIETIDFLYEQFSYEFQRFKNISSIHFLNRDLLENFMNINYSSMENMNDLLYLFNIKQIVYGKDIFLYISLEDLKNRKIIWKKRFAYRDTGILPSSKLLSKFVTDKANELFDETGFLYKYILNMDSINLIDKPSIMSQFYKLKFSGLEKYEFMSLYNNVISYLEKFPKDLDVLSAYCFMCFYSKFNLLNIVSDPYKKIDDLMLRMIKIDPSNIEVQNIINWLEYYRINVPEIPDYSSIHDDLYANTPSKAYFKSFREYLRGKHRGQEDNMRKLSSSLFVTDPISIGLNSLQRSEQGINNKKLILKEAESMSGGHRVIGILLCAYAFYTNGKREEASRTISKLNQYEMDDLDWNLHTTISNRRFVDTVIKTIDDIRAC